MIRYFRDNKGIALILTILVISIIVALTLQFNTSMRSNLHAAANLSDGIKLACIARSGFNCALAVLFEDLSKGSVDSLREPWANSKNISENSTFLFEEDRFLVDILDHSGRIQINQLIDKDGKYNDTQKRILTRFLNFPEFDLEPEEVDNIVDAIKDWIDTDNETTRFGAENAYYQTLEKPYTCKNGPIEFLEELLFVKGITKELYYGSGEKPGIFRYLSPHGNSRININTADPLVLRALSEQIEKDLAEDMVIYREDKDNDLSDPGWYKKVPGMSHVVIDQALVTTSSEYFEIISEGLKGAMSKRIKGVVERKQGALKILSWRVE